MIFLLLSLLSFSETITVEVPEQVLGGLDARPPQYFRLAETVGASADSFSFNQLELPSRVGASAFREKGIPRINLSAVTSRIGLGSLFSDVTYGIGLYSLQREGGLSLKFSQSQSTQEAFMVPLEVRPALGFKSGVLNFGDFSATPMFFASYRPTYLIVEENLVSDSHTAWGHFFEGGLEARIRYGSLPGLKLWGGYTVGSLEGISSRQALYGLGLFL